MNAIDIVGKNDIKVFPFFGLIEKAKSSLEIISLTVNLHVNYLKWH